MNDTGRELPSPVELPAPITGASPSAGEQLVPNSLAQGTHEKMPFNDVEANSGAGQNGGAPAATQQSLGDDRHHASQAAQLAGATPQIADDADLIEKEWVEKAKEIVEKTRDNPYLQNKAINEMKTDYIKKRYNKDIANTDKAS
jgi:hypothetical protein